MYLVFFSDEGSLSLISKKLIFVLSFCLEASLKYLIIFFIKLDWILGAHDWMAFQKQKTPKTPLPFL